jgi:hypothetical protein
MDRFLDEEDIGRQDFVRKEYALALKLKKNIVPVKHEDFVFPEKNRVPTDVQAVVGMNAIPWISAYREPPQAGETGGRRRRRSAQS